MQTCHQQNNRLTKGRPPHSKLHTKGEQNHANTNIISAAAHSRSPHRAYCTGPRPHQQHLSALDSRTLWATIC